MHLYIIHESYHFIMCIIATFIHVPKNTKNVARIVIVLGWSSSTGSILFRGEIKAKKFEKFSSESKILFSMIIIKNYAIFLRYNIYFFFHCLALISFKTVWTQDCSSVLLFIHYACLVFFFFTNQKICFGYTSWNFALYPNFTNKNNHSTFESNAVSCIHMRVCDWCQPSNLFWSKVISIHQQNNKVV